MEVTPYVGIENQEATCYMNSLLQTLYHIPSFRKALYKLPVDENDDAEESLPLALQRLFYNLECRDTSVNTTELTKSLHWNEDEPFTHHDVHEFYKILSDKLEDKMKGTCEEDTMKKLFEGQQTTCTECIDVEYKSPQNEYFHDVHLVVRGCSNVYSSLDKYVEVERMEGENLYAAGEHGLQIAKKSTLFKEFPPILQLHLRRFELVNKETKKINDRYEYPVKLDLDKYLSPDAEKKGNQYILYSVFVHSGDSQKGHYYAYIRPTLTQWYKFDDKCVTKEVEKAALEDHFGGYENRSNAYMLIYIRESEKDNIFCTVEEKDIAEHLRRKKKSSGQQKKEEREREVVTMGQKVEGDVSLKGNYSGIEYTLKNFKKYERGAGRLLVVFLYYVGTVKFPSFKEENAIFVACFDEYEADEICAYARMLTKRAAMLPRGFLKAKDNEGLEQVLLIYYPFQCLLEDHRLEEFLSDTKLNWNPIRQNPNTTVTSSMKDLIRVVKEMKEHEFSTVSLQYDIAYVKCCRTGSIALLLGKITKADTVALKEKMDSDFMVAIQGYLLKDCSVECTSFFRSFKLKNCFERLDMFLYHPFFEDDLNTQVNFWSHLYRALQLCALRKNGYFRGRLVKRLTRKLHGDALKYDWMSDRDEWCDHFKACYSSEKTKYSNDQQSNVKFLSNTVEHIPDLMTYEELLEHIDATWDHPYHRFHEELYIEDKRLEGEHL